MDGIRMRFTYVHMIKLLILTSLPIFFLTPLFADNSDFFISSGETNRDITVSLKNDFRITLEGKGWYLNRYQRNSLSFRLRTIKTDRTVFLIAPLREGASYLLFSHLNADVYVTVHVVAVGKTAPAIGEEKGDKAVPGLRGGEGSGQAVSRGQKEEGGGEKESGVKKQVNETAVSKGQGKSAARESKKSGADSKPGEKQAEKQPLLKNKVYYIDKNSQTVEVPTQDENDLYRDAVKAIKNNEYRIATEKLTKYLSSCSVCRYSAAARMALADIYMEQKEYDKALQNLDTLTGVPKTLQKNVYLKKAEIYSITGDLQNAGLSYKKAYETDQNDIEILEKLGNIYYQNGRYEDALDTYEEGIAHGLVNDEILFRTASIYDQPGPRKNIEKAYRYYRKLVDTFETSRYRMRSLERVRFFEKNFYNYR